MLLNCLKCGERYETEDPDPYYCKFCLEEKQKLAKKIDMKFANIKRKSIKSELQIYDELCQLRGSRFLNAKDLGL